MKKYLLILFVSVFFLGCYGPKKMAKAFDPWIGQNINSMLEVWGPPTKTFDFPNGSGKIYTWIYLNGSTVATENSGSSGTEGCEFNWTVDNNDVIKSYRYKGNCRYNK